MVSPGGRQRREFLLPPELVGTGEGAAAAAGVLSLLPGGDDHVAERAGEAVDRQAVKDYRRRGEAKVVSGRPCRRDGVRRGRDGEDGGLPGDGLRRGQSHVEDAGLEGGLGGTEVPREVARGSQGRGWEEEAEEEDGERARRHRDCEQQCR